MYEVSVRQHFDAAHYLRGYQGKCEDLHGHRFEVVVSVRAQSVDQIGLAYDFIELKELLREILERYDHTCLNEKSPFDQINPSSENIATIIYQELKERLGEAPHTISSVQVWESPETCVTFIP